ncbi:UDP-N-acetylmuramate dehydrogenase [Gilvimarinus agarilyticus]|uniref:UDP-N-acetylmuramate dehydrogenase n=1 Tax=Gilvimarinus agarilyticus TaxID=679259 RepID=UPI00059F8AFC|nr:UDP-N-acetylmuramate dehydrogenase [Gilvimarinus agarilyticus]
MALFLPEFDLQRFNTLAIAARAQFYVAVTTHDEVLEALAFARERQLPVLPLGGGSNIVLADNYPGLVMHIKLRGIEPVAEDAQSVWVRAAAGENWHEFVQHCLMIGCYGLENLSLIPGSVGAAPIQNIGAYGVELQQRLSELSAVDIRSGLPVTFTAESCNFAYRDSVFKHSARDRYIITSVTFKLDRAVRPVLDYPSLRQQLQLEPDGGAPAEAHFSAQQIADAVIAVRQEKLPDPATTPNAGSFFKNPLVDAATFAALQQRYPDIVSYPQADGRVKLAAGWLIDRAGWRGYRAGDVAVHSEQALVITNPGRGSGASVLALADEITRSVFSQYGVTLELEPRVYPA